jgi:hypothetical protein
MKRRFIIAASLLALGLVLAGCGGSGSDDVVGDGTNNGQNCSDGSAPPCPQETVTFQPLTLTLPSPKQAARDRSKEFLRRGLFHDNDSGEWANSFVSDTFKGDNGWDKFRFTDAISWGGGDFHCCTVASSALRDANLLRVFVLDSVASYSIDDRGYVVQNFTLRLQGTLKSDRSPWQTDIPSRLIWRQEQGIWRIVGGQLGDLYNLYGN